MSRTTKFDASLNTTTASVRSMPITALTLLPFRAGHAGPKFLPLRTVRFSLESEDVWIGW